MQKIRQTLGISRLRRGELMGGPYVALIAMHEAMVKCLYETFAVAFKGMSKFWTHLAREEEQHFRLVKALEGDLHNSDVTFKRPAFTQSQVKDSIAWICARKMRVEKGGVTVREALRMCIQIEQGMIEHRFFDIMEDDHESVRHVLNQLEKSSIAHLRRARNEAGSIKWKLFGGKKCKPVPEGKRIDEPINTCEDPKAAIKTAQAAILAALMTLEEAAGSLYNTYAELLPDSSSLWSALAAEEFTHAKMLHGLEDMLEKGALFTHMGQFGISSIKQGIDEILNAESRAQRDGISYNDAMLTALRTESYMAECEFYKTVESDAPEFKYIANRLMDLTQAHIKRLEEATAPMELLSAEQQKQAEAEKAEDQASKWGSWKD